MFLEPVEIVYFLAMAQHSLGEKLTARGTFEQALRCSESVYHEVEELQRFRREAEQVLGISAEKSKTR